MRLSALFLRRSRALLRGRQRLLEKPSGLPCLREEASADQDNAEHQYWHRHEKPDGCVSRCSEKCPGGQSNGVSDTGEPDEHEHRDNRVKEHDDVHADAGRHGRDTAQNNWKEGVSVPDVAPESKSVTVC